MPDFERSCSSDRSSFLAARPFGIVRFREYAAGSNVTSMYWCNKLDINRMPTDLLADRSAVRLWIDVDSTLRIEFDKKLLAEDLLNSLERKPGSLDPFLTWGRLSLQAFVGKREIEVEQYGKVGKGRDPVGPARVPAAVFFFNVVQLQEDLERFARQVTPASESDNSRAQEGKEGTSPKDVLRLAIEVNALMATILEDQRSFEAFLTTIEASPVKTSELASELSNLLKGIGDTSNANARFSQEELEQLVAKKNAEKREREASDYAALGKLDKETLDARSAEAKAWDQYRAASKSDERWCDPANISDESARVACVNARAASTKAEESTRRFLDARREMEERADETARAIRRITMDPGDQAASDLAPRLSQVLKDLGGVVNAGYRTSRQNAKETTSPGTQPTIAGLRQPTSDDRIRLIDYWKDPNNGESRLERAVGVIYQNLVPGSIVVADTGASVGDEIEVRLVRYEYPTRSTPQDASPLQARGDPPGSTIGRFVVGQFRTGVRVVDSVLLVKKVSEPNDSSGVVSNFKAAPGFSLLFNYRPRPEEHLRPAWRWLLRNASGGVNVSYVDFDPEKQFEVGVGVVVGLFRDQIHGGVGWNLNIPGKPKDRMYWFLGFSFARLGETLGVTKPGATKQLP